jgi:hypothetical protein
VDHKEIITTAIRSAWSGGERREQALVDEAIFASRSIALPLAEIVKLAQGVYVDLTWRSKSRHAPCPHGRRKCRCSICHGTQKTASRQGKHIECEHGRRKTRCPDCKGGGVCSHGLRKDRCRDCSGCKVCRHFYKLRGGLCQICRSKLKFNKAGELAIPKKRRAAFTGWSL